MRSVEVNWGPWWLDPNDPHMTQRSNGFYHMIRSWYRKVFAASSGTGAPLSCPLFHLLRWPYAACDSESSTRSSLQTPPDTWYPQLSCMCVTSPQLHLHPIGMCAAQSPPPRMSHSWSCLLIILPTPIPVAWICRSSLLQEVHSDFYKEFPHPSPIRSVSSLCC